MSPQPVAYNPAYKGTGKLKDKVAIITGGDSGIGRAVSILFAQEGAKVMIVYLEESKDAAITLRIIDELGGTAASMAGDLGDPSFCQKVVQQTLAEFEQIDILVNNAAEQHPQDSVAAISPEQLIRTFQTNVFAYFYLTQEALPHLEKTNGCIINTTSVTAYRGSEHLIDYSATKGAIVAFTRSLALSLVDKKVRVNGVAPGPVWTPLIVSTFDSKESSKFGEQAPMGRPGQPVEIAPSFLFLASRDASFMSGQILHPNGGEIING